MRGSFCFGCLFLAQNVADKNSDEHDGADIAGDAVDEVDEVAQTEQTRADHAEHGQRDDTDAVFPGLFIRGDLAAEAPHHRAGRRIDCEDDHHNEDALRDGTEQTGKCEIRNLRGADEIEVAEDGEDDDCDRNMEEAHAEHGGSGGGLLVDGAGAHGGQRRRERHHGKAGVRDAAQPPGGGGFAQVHGREHCVNVAEVGLGQCDNADDQGKQRNEGADGADDVGQLAQTKPDGDDGGGGHQARADQRIPVEVLVEGRAGAVEHDEIAAADKNGAEPVENLAGGLAKVVGENVVLVSLGDFLALIEQFLCEKEVNDQRNGDCTDRAGNAVRNEEGQKLRAGCKSGTDAGRHECAAEDNGAFPIDFVVLHVLLDLLSACLTILR